MKIVSSWSGGKDSCLACYKASRAGHEVSCLLNLVSEDGKKCCFHGIDAELLKAQAGSMGIPLVQKAVPRDMKEYEAAFKSAVSELRDEHGIEGMVFGDIYLDEHKDWVERVCGEIGIKALEPLWNAPVEDIMSEFIDSGFKAVVVSAKADLFDGGILQKDVDREFVKGLKDRNICVCGENGEFHTFVYDGPNFSKSIRIGRAEKTLKKGFWDHWSLDVKSFSLSGKSS